MSRQFWEELMNTATLDGTAVNTTTVETILFPAFTITAGYLEMGRCLVIKAMGRLITTATPTIRFRARIGGLSGTVVWDSGTVTLTTMATAALWWLDLLIQSRSNGTAGTVFCMGPCIIGSAAAPAVGSATNAPAVLVGGSGGVVTPSTGAVDMTVDNQFNLTAQWSASSASNSAQGHNFICRSLN